MGKTFQGVLRICQRAAVAVIAVTCLTAAYYTLRLAYAEYLFRSGAKEKIDRAAALVPLRAEYQARAGQLERAVRLNPYFSAAWMELGLRAEAEGQLTKAEPALLEAARVDKTFEPRWTLANFYFRRNNWAEFWKWIRASAEMSYGDRSALFRLCWAASQNPDEILAKAIPSNPSVLGDYLDYLAHANRFEAAESAALRLLTSGQSADTARLLAFCDQLLDSAHRPESALRIWNDMIGRGWLPYPRLDPDSGSSLTNGDFAISPRSHGFDWRLLDRTPFRTVWTDSPRGLLISFDGKQEERSDILDQWLPLLPSSSYELSVRAESSDIPRDSGLRWRIVGADLDALGGTLRFTTTTQTAARLILSYHRALGTSRIEGKLRLVSVSLERHGPRMNTDKHR
jgi:tetratricopeptide (TPR) repeat protein